MLNLHRWDLYIRHFLAFVSLNWNCDRWRSYLRRLSRCKWSRSAMTLRVVGCLVKPVCFRKYCDIHQSLTVHRSLARYSCRPTQSTTSSLLNANFTHACPYSRQNFLATWKRRRLKQSTHCTAKKLAQRLLFLLFLLRRMSGDQTTLTLGQCWQPVTYAYHTCILMLGSFYLVIL